MASGGGPEGPPPSPGASDDRAVRTARERRPVLAVIYEMALPGTTYRDWTDAVFLGTVGLAALTTIVFVGWRNRPELANIFMGSAAFWGLLAGFFYGQWRAVEPGSFQSTRLRVRSSKSLGVLYVLLLLVLAERITGF